jgi:hypothetical protein
MLDSNYRKTRIERSEIATLEESEVSVMPEGLLDKVTPQELRNLFAFLQSTSRQ